MTESPDISRPAERSYTVGRQAHPVLEVVVAPHCFGCTRARALAAEAAARFPTLEVRMVDLGQPGTEAPACIVAVPAYVLNGRVLFTGNPTPDALAAVCAAAIDPDGVAPDTTRCV